MNSILGAELPENWASSRLKYVTAMLHRGTAPSYADSGAVRAISQAANQADGIDWSRTRFHDYAGDPLKLKGYLLPHDVLVNSTGTGTLGRIGYFDGAPDDSPCMADSNITLVRTKAEEFHPRFAYYWMSSRVFQEYISAALIVGSTNQIELSRERLGDAPTPIPPPEEQRRIARFLDSQTALIDKLIDKMRTQNNLLTTRRRAILAAARSPNARVVRIGYFLQLVTSGPRGWSEYITPDGTKFFRSANLRRDSISPNLESIVHVSPPPSAAAEVARSKVHANDVLVGITGANTGWVAHAGCEVVGANVSQHVCLLRPSPEIHGRWLAYLLSSPQIQDELLGSQYGGTKSQLSLPDLRDLRVPLPALSEQERTARIIDQAIDAVDRQRTMRRHQLGLLVERRQALITAAVTGQIDVITAREVSQ